MTDEELTAYANSDPATQEMVRSHLRAASGLKNFKPEFTLRKFIRLVDGLFRRDRQKKTGAAEPADRKQVIEDWSCECARHDAVERRPN